MAAEAGNADVMRVLLDYGFDPNLPTANGYLPVHLAALSQKPEALTTLAEFGWDVRAKGPDGRTALEIAESATSLEMMKLATQLSGRNPAPVERTPAHGS